MAAGLREVRHLLVLLVASASILVALPTDSAATHGLDLCDKPAGERPRPTADVAYAIGSANQVNVRFSMAMEQASAETLENYHISPDVGLFSATLQTDGHTVVLATGTLATGQEYTLTVDPIKDGCPAGQQDVTPPNTELTFQRLPLAGRVETDLIALYVFSEGSGDRVHDIAQHPDAPVDLVIDPPDAVQWVPEAGLRVKEPVTILSADPASKIIDACMSTGEITIEAWVTPGDAGQGGPARIVSLSKDPWERNFTLAQEVDVFDVRLRTTSTSDNGIPSVSSSAGSVRLAAQHVVYRREVVAGGGIASLFVDGRLEAAEQLDGAFSNWDPTMVLSMANEVTNDRPWTGFLHLVAIYDRALTDDEIAQNNGVSAVLLSVPADPPGWLALVVVTALGLGLGRVAAVAPR